MKYSKSSLWKKIVESPLSIIVLIIFVFILSKASYNISSRASISRQTLIESQLELTRQTERQHEIADKVQQLSTEQGLENEIRTKYHAVKEGESVAVIIDNSENASIDDASITTQIIKQQASWWSKVLAFFGF